MSRELREALEGISQIRSQIARSSEFKGYGAATVAASGVVAWVAAGLQALLVPDPVERFGFFLLIWTAAAVLSVFLVGIEMVRRARRHHTALAWKLVWAVFGQILPAGAAGALLTLVLLPAPSEMSVLLPGLWQILFSLGLFASIRFLPRGSYAAAAWYLGAGVIVLLWLRSGMAPSPWVMGIPFGVGQFLLAAAFRLGGDKP